MIRTFTAAIAVGSVGWVLVVIEAKSDAGVSVLQLLVLYYGLPLLLIPWGVVLAVHLGRRTQQPAVRSTRLLLILPLLCALGVLLLPPESTLLRWRLRLSASALEASAQETWQQSRLVGLFVVSEKTVVGDELRFKTAECHILDACGLVYSPAGPPQTVGEDSFTQIAGSWWHWRDSW